MFFKGEIKTKTDEPPHVTATKESGIENGMSLKPHEIAVVNANTKWSNAYIHSGKKQKKSFFQCHPYQSMIIGLCASSLIGFVSTYLIDVFLG